jgi:signal recognition particle subunit SRP72
MPPRKQQQKAPAAPVKGDIKIVDGKRKFTPRPPLPAAERLPRLYRALTDQVNDGFFDNAKKTCKRSEWRQRSGTRRLTPVLALDAASTSAFQTLLFLHLHTDDYAAALDLVEHPPAPAELQFERAYCLYRLHRERDALQQLQEIKARGRREEHLEAQVVSL